MRVFVFGDLHPFHVLSDAKFPEIYETRKKGQKKQDFFQKISKYLKNCFNRCS